MNVAAMVINKRKGRSSLAWRALTPASQPTDPLALKILHAWAVKLAFRASFTRALSSLLRF
jgi:hypothetical protein